MDQNGINQAAAQSVGYQQAAQDYLARQGSSLAGAQNTAPVAAAAPLDIIDNRIRAHAARLAQAITVLDSLASKLDGAPPQGQATTDAQRPERSGAFGRISDGLDGLDSITERLGHTLARLHKLIG